MMKNPQLLMYSQLTLWLNHTLNQSGLCEPLKPFAGQAICLTCYQDKEQTKVISSLTASFLVTAQGELFLATEPLNDAVTTVQVQVVLPELVANLAKIRGNQQQSKILQSLHISGSAAFANALAAVANQWHWDIGEDISQTLQKYLPLPIADLMTQRVHEDVLATGGFFKKTARNQEIAIAQWLSQEKAVLLDQSLMRQFQEDLFSAREDIDRLDKRIQHLKKNMA